MGSLGLAKRRRSRHRRVESCNQVHQEPTISIVISMACRIPAVSSTLSCRSLGRSRTASRLGNGQSLLPFSSRASCPWTRNNSIRHHQALLVAKTNNLCRIQQSGVFSTSARYGAELKDGKDANSPRLHAHKKVGQPPSTPCSTQSIFALSWRKSKPNLIYKTSDYDDYIFDYIQ